MVVRAGIEPATPAASGQRSTGELPGHKNKKPPDLHGWPLGDSEVPKCGPCLADTCALMPLFNGIKRDAIGSAEDHVEYCIATLIQSQYRLEASILRVDQREGTGDTGAA
jgi:hypothetical protein